MTLAIDIAPELESRVRKAAASNGVSPEVYVSLLIKESIDNLAVETELSEATEEMLLEQINIGLSQEQWQRYRALRAKLDAETLTESEHQELIALSDYREIQNAKGLEALSQLANLRQSSLREIMHDLGITTPTYE